MKKLSKTSKSNFIMILKIEKNVPTNLTPKQENSLFPKNYIKR